jgi:hypothetical protein
MKYSNSAIASLSSPVYCHASEAYWSANLQRSSESVHSDCNRNTVDISMRTLRRCSSLSCGNNITAFSYIAIHRLKSSSRSLSRYRAKSTRPMASYARILSDSARRSNCSSPAVASTRGARAGDNASVRTAKSVAGSRESLIGCM